uniref:Uncharacterized protein MANES_01G271700 n=1 Tax=Rhizophora mucronata TaxID=61149 RepID=A0A2P2JUJ0_RHIMU
MVFASVPESETQPIRNNHSRLADMASSSPNLKSHQKPLHNFSLHDLKWSMNHGSNHRVRKQHAGDSSSRKSPLGRAPAAAASDRRMTEAPRKKSSDAAPAVENPEKKTKIFIRIRTKNSSNKAADDAVPPVPSDAAAADYGKQESNAEAAEVPELEPEPKVWNLRPRRRLNKKPNAPVGAPKIGGAAALRAKADPPSRPELNRPRNANDAKEAAAEKKENEEEKEEENEKEKVKEKEKGKEKEKVTKPKLSITLTQQEIEEDIFSLTGSRPSRKPKKRAKDVQKALDRLFPGTCLCDVTPDSYKVQEPHIKPNRTNFVLESK